MTSHTNSYVLHSRYIPFYREGYTLSDFDDRQMFEGRLLSKEALPFDHRLLLKMSAKKVHEVTRLSYRVGVTRSNLIILFIR